jgi:hypothetical protein
MFRSGMMGRLIDWLIDIVCNKCNGKGIVTSFKCVCHWCVLTELQNPQYKKCTYKVILRRVGATIVEEEKQWVLYTLSVCICTLRYPAYNAHAPYFHLWPAPLYNIFLHLINGTIFEKEFLNSKCVLIFSTTSFWNISHSKKKWERYDKKMYIGLHVRYPSFSSDLNENWTFSTEF